MDACASTSAAPDLLSDFFGAAVHLILFSRQVYPADSFERRRLFDVAVYKSRHPELLDYVALAVRGVCELIESGEGDALVVLILGLPRSSSQGHGARPAVLERFTFEFQGAAALREGASETDLRAQLRGFLLKLHVCDALLAPLPDVDLSFSLELHARSAGAGAPLSDELRERWAECGAAEVGVLPSPCIVPLKSLKAGQFSMQCYVQT